MSQGEKTLDRFAREYPAGAVVFREGEPGASMYVIRAGTVRLSLHVRDTEMNLSTLSQGEFFGEMAILNNAPRSATATVVEEAILLEIEPKVFETMLRSNSEIALRMIQRLADRLAYANRHIQTLLLKDHVSRVASYLLSELQRQGLEYGKLRIAMREVLVQTGVSEAEAGEAVELLGKLGLVLTNAQGGFSIPDGMALARYLELPPGDWAAAR